MATLKTNTLTGTSTAGSIAVTGESGSTTTNLQQGLVKCWVNFDGSASGAAARDSFNVSGMTDSATGNYVVTFSNNMANASFSGVAVQGNNDATNAGVNATSAVGHTASSASGIETSNLDPASTDYQQISASYNGDLA